MISPGDKLDGKYRIVRRLGAGGFGEVYLAQDEFVPARQVAIKVLRRRPEGDQSDLIWEMQQLATLNHPHVVTFYHHFADAERLYLVMEFCAGGSLDDRLIAIGRSPEEQVFALGVELCETLAIVHARGIVHHDIKPSNVLFAADDTVKLGDFGVANRGIGTLLYLPPEVILGGQRSRHDGRVDIYALGLTLLESLIGRHPFEDLDEGEAIRVRVKHAFVPAELPLWNQEVLLKATHPTPELRYQTAAEFAEAIRRRRVPYVFKGDRIKADALAGVAERALARGKWKWAERVASYALRVSPESVPALVAAGRCQLRLRRLDQASEYFSRAISINPRVPVQKELGWVSLERGHLPTAISMLTDHLQRNASDYEAFNLLLKCFYLTDRFEAGYDLGRVLIEAKAPSACFAENATLCWLLLGDQTPKAISERASSIKVVTPYLNYNVAVVMEDPSSWNPEGNPSLKSKLLFAEYQVRVGKLTKRPNTVRIYMGEGPPRDFKKQIIGIGSLEANDVWVDHPTVSRRHCVIVNESRDIWLHDLESTLRTVVDGRPVAGRIFLDGVHEVTIGQAQIRVAASSGMLV